MDNRTFKAGCRDDFVLREIHIKKGGNFIEIKSKNPDEVETQLRENCGHLVAFAGGNIDFPVLLFEDKIVIYTDDVLTEQPAQKGIAA